MDEMRDTLFEYRNSAAQTMAHATTAKLGACATFINDCITREILPVKVGDKQDPCRDAAVISKMYWLWVIGQYEQHAETGKGVDVSLHAYLEIFPYLVEDFGEMRAFHSYVAYGGPVRP